MRTLVVSDLHLGARSGSDVLRSAPARAPLLEMVSGCERLVLLGDVLELRHGLLRGALEAAAPVLAELGAALGADGEVVIVPGNHDHRLLRPWLERRACTPSRAPLSSASEVDYRAGDPLGELARQLAPARVRAAYPGLWLREDLYATHGHYSDRHNTVPIIERLGSGAMARLVREPPGGPRRIDDYEATLGTMYAWIDAVVAARADGDERDGGGEERAQRSVQVDAWRQLTGTDGRSRPIRRAALRLTFLALVGALNRAGLGPLRTDVSGPDLRRGALRGFSEALARLGIAAPHVLFGHTHRAGPLPGDERREWLAPTGARLFNTGSWVWESSFLGADPLESPYRPGFCALVHDAGAPELRALLDEQLRDGSLA